MSLLSSTAAASAAMLALRRVTTTTTTRPSAVFRLESDYCRRHCIGGSSSSNSASRSSHAATIASVVRSRRIAVASSSTTAAASESPPATKYLDNYNVFEYDLTSVELDFELGEKTIVKSKLTMVNKDGYQKYPLKLNGDPDTISLKSLKLNGAELSPLDSPVGVSRRDTGYFWDTREKVLSLGCCPIDEEFVVEAEVEIEPAKNTALEGLYKSSGNFCTQCEAEGFRRITFYPDRPDVLSTFRVRISTNASEKDDYPLLLSNGNLVESGEGYAVWEDPFPKPCYLFALVAGALECRVDTFQTASGRDVTLKIYAQEHNIDKVSFALESLKSAMRWDETRFGLEYDLDVFHIVAVDDFNMGAMENKSLNIFNSRLVLASAKTATDSDFEAIESVVGHEYFHNWTGNRVTCRDWFQLSLKEGLTVFRDQEFSADMNSESVCRIKDVARLRRMQFPEDAGPMAHPVRPSEYIKMDNFYTVTVYEKGAEIVRMYQSLFGKEGFRKGLSLYISRHDGQAVTCEDFLYAMEDANDRTIYDSFMNWYTQSGTPLVEVEHKWNVDKGEMTLQVKQSVGDTPGQDSRSKAPFLIPLRIAFLDGSTGEEIPFHRFTQKNNDSQTETQRAIYEGITEVVLELDESSHSLSFPLVVPVNTKRVIPSLLRGFSAPVRMKTTLTTQDLLFLLENDSDAFNRWESAQTIARGLLEELYKNGGQGSDQALAAFAGALSVAVSDSNLDPAFRSALLALPSVSELVDTLSECDITLLYACHLRLEKQVATAMKDTLRDIVESGISNRENVDQIGHEVRALRSLQGTALRYLARLETPQSIDAEGDDNLIRRVWNTAGNMTEQMAALAAVNDIGGDLRESMLSEFYNTWKHDSLVMNKWLSLQAASNIPSTPADRLKTLMTDESVFDIRNPNKVYATVGGFASSIVNFHCASGEGYTALADIIIELDAINPQVAARMVTPLTRFRQYDRARQALMKSALQTIQSRQLSDNLFEVVSKSLEAGSK